VIDLFKDMVRQLPNQPEWPLYLGRCLNRMGKLDEALRTLEALRTRWNPPVVLAELGMVYARLGRRSNALAMLRQMDEQASNRYVAPYFRAQIHAALGDSDPALDQLEKAYEDRCEHLVNADSWGLRTDPGWKDLQAHPRFQELLKKVGLDVWPK
jgi:tetratricopeptide (TPR) repeat protein